MKLNIIILFLFAFDIYAFMQGKAYHVSETYEAFYIKHTISAEQYAARMQNQADTHKILPMKSSTLEELKNTKLFLP